jgi:DNA-binding LytR/AlgR family response regulator
VLLALAMTMLLSTFVVVPNPSRSSRLIAGLLWTAVIVVLTFLIYRTGTISRWRKVFFVTFAVSFVLVRAYDQYTLRAFEESAIDYVLKPFAAERIAKAVERAARNRRPVDDALIARLQAALARPRYLRFFPVKLGEEILLVPESEVVCFAAEDKSTWLCTFDRRFPIDLTLKQLEEQLDPEHFCRVHKSQIVALAKIRKIGKWFHGEYVLRLADKASSTVRLGRSYQAAFGRTRVCRPRAALAHATLARPRRTACGHLRSAEGETLPLFVRCAGAAAAGRDPQRWLRDRVPKPGAS